LAGKEFQGYLDSTLMAIFIVGVILVVGDAGLRIWSTLHGEPIPQEAFGAPEVDGAVKMRCC
jgi:hypothetical protein